MYVPHNEFCDQSVGVNVQQEELRQQGGKYAHLNHDLHVWVEAVGHPMECYQKVFHAFRLIHPFLVPVWIIVSL